MITSLRFVRIAVFALFTIFLLPFAATAYDVTATLKMVDDYVITTGIHPDEAALLRANALFAPEKLPAALKIETRQHEGWFCGTPAILALQEAALEASPAVRQEMEGVLPWKSRFDANPIAGGKDGKDFNPNGADPLSVNNYQTEHFNIYWGDETEYSLEDMQNWGTILEEIWSIEVDEWGWDDIYLSDLYYVDVYLGNSGEGVPNIPFQGAYTTIYNNLQPYMVFHPDILYNDSYIKDISSHEFFHCMQFTVAVQPGGCYFYMGQENNWGIEGTAVWAEDEVYDELNHYKYQIGSYAEAPHTSLTTTDFYQVYARVIWWKYISENFDGRETIYDLFHGVCRSSLLDALHAIFRDNQTDIFEEYTRFARGNLFLKDSYEEGYSYPDFAISKKISSYPNDYEPQSSRSAQPLGVNYIKLTPDGENDYLTIDFEGEMKIGGRPFDEWNIQILAMKNEKAEEDYDLTTMQVSEEGEGSASLEGFGTDYDQVYVLVSPLDDEPRTFRGSEYTISFDVAEAPPSEDDDDDDETTDDDDDVPSQGGDDDDDDDDSGGCGC